MPYAPSQTWDLDRIFPGGPGGAAFHGALAKAKARAQALIARCDALGPVDGGDAWRSTLLEMVDAETEAAQLSAWAGCARAADTLSEAADLARKRSDEVIQLLQRASVPVQSALGEADDAAFESLATSPDLADVAPRLRHQRDGRKLLLAKPLQELMVELDRDGLHGWGQLYDEVSGTLEAVVEVPGQPPKTVGVASLQGLKGHADERVRKASHQAGQRAWGKVAPLCAMALTNITGSRQTRYDRCGVGELASSFHRNRITPDIVDAMWSAADEARPALVAYLDRKAKLLGKPKLDWWDQLAPVGADGKGITWEAAQDLVVEAFGRFSPDLRDFAVKALSGRWIDAEERPGRAQGGFCTELPLSNESRIFLTFSGTLDTTMTLAHELGHAFHNEVLFAQPYVRRDVTSALAETASTFAEAVVRDFAVDTAKSASVRAMLLDQQLEAGVAFLMNIPARYQFERRLFELRRDGPFTPDQLSAEMVAIQRRTHGDALASWDPTFWASKLHFYISEFGFYNWPYAFGYLFSGAVYQRFKDEGRSFVPTYRKLLERTGWDDTASIGRNVLGEDLADPAFWKRAVQPLIANSEAFLDATK